MIILRIPMAGVSTAALARFAGRACRAASLKGELTILITGDEEVRDLNRRFRKKDKATDVLSFPSEVPDAAGDIAISAEIASENGQRLGHGPLTELKVLILHGVLHLAGFDHEVDEGRMARKESRLRAELGLREGLIERSAGAPAKSNLPSAKRAAARKKSAPRKATAKTPRKGSAKTKLSGVGSKR